RVRHALGDLRLPPDSGAPYLATLPPRFPRRDQLYTALAAAARPACAVAGLRIEAAPACPLDMTPRAPSHPRRVRMHTRADTRCGGMHVQQRLAHARPLRPQMASGLGKSNQPRVVVISVAKLVSTEAIHLPAHTLWRRLGVMRIVFMRKQAEIAIRAVALGNE